LKSSQLERDLRTALSLSKNRSKCSPTHFFKTNTYIISTGEKVDKKFLSFSDDCSNHPMGEISPNLVTLVLNNEFTSYSSET
jgi:hypothetical protein